MSGDINLVAIPDAIKADESVVRPVWSILSKGRTGTGKTVASCGKEFRPTYVFNLEGRFESVITYYKKRDGHIKGLYYNDFHMGSGFYPLDKKMDAIVARPEFKTVVVSSLTSYIHIVLLHLMKSTAPKDSAGSNLRKKGGIQVNILEDFNFEDAAIIYELLNFLQQLKADGVNVILEAHISPYEEVTLEGGQRVVKTINQILTKGKKAPAQIPSYFNEVWLFDKIYSGSWESGNQEAKYLINTSGSATDEAKTSFGIPSFEWTNQDPTVRLMEFLNPDIKKQERIDPNAPKRMTW
jgi:hypothetical protein